MRARWKAALPVVATVALVVPVAVLWQRSLVADSHSVMEMGYADHGGAPATEHHHGTVDLATLTGPQDRAADVAVTLTARAEPVTTGAGVVTGYTLNHASPGPEIRARRGQLVEVRLVNESVPDGVTLHWHGVDVPNAEDGVAGITQDAVRPGGEHVYRFVAEDAGTYWYHSHQVGSEQVRLGLFGALVVDAAPADDHVALVHSWNSRRTLGAAPGETRVAAAPGATVRVRIVNTDAGPIKAWVTGAPYRIAAVDGRDVHGPADVTAAVLVTAGGRIDVVFAVPAGDRPVRVDVGGGAALLVGGAGPAAADPVPATTVDLLTYGTPAALGFDPAAADRRFTYDIGRRIGFLDGRPGMWWTVNGHLYPDVPMYVVDTGDVVRMTVSNHSGEVHPMHLHGHHAVVLSRNGVAATGSPWWVDSLDVNDDETYEIAFVADNPGVWADHCHNLPHAAEGLLAHLAYTGVRTPYVVGGPAHNRPE